ncbi:cyclic nucleotide-binding domain-containing protein [Exilibacterium tricleocarpae]|uniref:Cyclic nucleotide-binding domain-containing protein n=1 Tax=Exilibacterium tricleocarpae TaxID=2591008 RepID=A0A545T018_9GAMM|nr:nitrate- and nitrite sensing domain-containing protein [Exilibacterium tricleocarpae]TQV70563.1 cyclic nucleotide-binding domain-containing protein [Exilibacterium tricleocarpae]
MKEVLTLTGDMVHELQKERGYMALFWGSEGEEGSNEVMRQFQVTDKTLIKLKEAAQRWEQQIKTIDKLNYRIKKIEQLSEQRSTINAADSPPYSIIHFYTYDIIAPLLEFMVEIALFDPHTDSCNVSAYSNFIQWKERTGRERATGVLGFSHRAADQETFVEELKVLVAEQETYKETFLALADTAQQACLNNVLNSRQTPDTDETIEAVHRALGDASGKSINKEKLLNSMTAKFWYMLMTKKIDGMHQVENLLIDTLAKSRLSAKEGAACHGVEPGGVSPRAIAFLKTLPFFSNLQDSLFNQLIQSAHIRVYKKGKILFLEREQPTRFYIILEGWVKLYKGTAAGEETILQMLSSGDAIVGSAVFLNTPYPLSAQIAEPATLISFPAAMVRQLIRDDNEFAVNMLTNLSHRSQLLIQQVEMVRLKCTTERVGWFLLKTLMNQSECNNRIKNSIKLPYDKAMIASYLDMKPETFSRTLKHFKNQGFHIENDTIILPSNDQLCQYCDVDIASVCTRHNTKDCPNPHCGR